ncbi:unnamed protein product [Penicillium salamii]|nr:unnamed protein product [Penicillium salamii]
MEDGVREWYHRLDSRVFDLVGDFAGSELFIIEGDSLLLHCFADPKLDFNPGLQMLHATYLVEQVIQKLRQRKCVFEIIFFAENARCCIPPTANSDLHERYLLARETIIQHLVSIGDQVSPPLQVLKFQSIGSEAFTTHLSKSGVYLIMCHDGAFAGMAGGSGMTSDAESEVQSDTDAESDDNQTKCDQDETCVPSHANNSKFKLRAMIYWLSARGCNTALINSMELRDTKVMIMVIEGSARRTTNRILPDLFDTNINAQSENRSDGGFELHNVNESLTRIKLNSNPRRAADTIIDPNDIVLSQEHIDELLQRVMEDQNSMTQRQCLVITTLSVMLSVLIEKSPENKIEAQAMILHLVLLQNTQLSDRGMRPQKDRGSQFFEVFLSIARVVLTSTRWTDIMTKNVSICDISDFLDGNVFFAAHSMLRAHGLKNVLCSATLPSFNTIASCVDKICGTSLQCKTLKNEVTSKKTPTGNPKKAKQSTMKKKKSPSSQAVDTVLPFFNSVFDDHLKPMHLEVDESTEPKNNQKPPKEFIEENHWHNSKPLEEKGRTVLTPQEQQRYRKRNQFFMSEMENYAASLAGSTGSTSPEIIVTGDPLKSNQSVRAKPQQKSTPNNNRSSGEAMKGLNKKKNAQNKSGNPDVRALAAASIQQKATEAAQKQKQKWKAVYQDQFACIADLETRFTKLNHYLSTMSKEMRCVLEPDVLLCLIHTLVQLIFLERQSIDENRHLFIVTRIWELISRLIKIKEGISADILNYVDKVCQILGLPSVQLELQSKEPLSFKPFEPPTEFSMRIGISPVEFQLSHGGHCMERTIETSPDPRTPDFDPDLWQRKVLDQIDLKKSVFIVAPTSAGKTFISFYAMKQILKEDDEGILVYVAPTKALVNQIAAEVLARFSKSYPAKASGKSVWAIHTRDYRINDPKGCQILITVPHILQIMLLSPTNANAWTPRIKRIIFDEIHCIGQAEDGVVWEQLLLLCPCPIVALSATVGNPQDFYDWLNLTQKANGLDLEMIQHRHRYSDLRKYEYQAPEAFSFKGFSSRIGLPRLGLDEAKDMRFIHPVTSLVDRSKPMPDDLDLEPRDCLMLWKAMNNLQTESFPMKASLNPSVFFSEIVIKKVHIIEWQKELKTLLAEWMRDQDSPFDQLLLDLGAPTSESMPKEAQEPSKAPIQSTDGDAELIYDTLPLVFSLHSQGALPALFFNYDRSKCEYLGRKLLEQLQVSEAEWKAESSVWKKKVEKWNAWKTVQDAMKKKTSNSTKKRRAGNDGDDDGPGSRGDQIKDSASKESTEFERFNPEQPLDNFNLADPKKVGPQEFSELASELKARLIPQFLIDGLERGIGVHHSGLNRRYRSVCEMLFRKGYLRVVFATGTLALGINMPCKTVVFLGDSIYLTALNFRQAAGRAGRRGFDLLGNVIFQGVPSSKVHRLISSRLPDLSGHFPITTSLVLRLFILLHGSKQAESAIKSINSLLSSPRIYLGGSQMKETVLHHLRFSIEYLRQNSLLDMKGVPLNFAGCVSHLYYTENSSFAFHALLSSGYLQRLCKEIVSYPKRTVLNLMLVMAHIFKRLPLRPAVLERYQTVEKKPSSIVALPPLPSGAMKSLRKHNKKVLAIYTAYVSSFVDQHIQYPDCHLPFSGMKCGGDKSPAELGFPKFDQISPKIVSPFYALSGNDDKCATISDLCQMVRSGVWIEESVIPYLAASPNVNAYLYDFFKHGNVSQLESANRIRRGDIWFLLNDFSLVLSTINASLSAFLDPTGKTQADGLDIVGTGDAHESLMEMQAIDSQVDTERPEKPKVGGVRNNQGGMMHSAPPKMGSQPRKKAPVDSWEDEMLSEDEEDVEKTEDKCDSRESKVQTKGRRRKARSEKKQLEKKVPAEKSHGSMVLVSRAFTELQAEFESKFRAMWA